MVTRFARRAVIHLRFSASSACVAANAHALARYAARIEAGAHLTSSRKSNGQVAHDRNVARGSHRMVLARCHDALD